MRQPLVWLCLGCTLSSGCAKLPGAEAGPPLEGKRLQGYWIIKTQMSIPTRPKFWRSHTMHSVVKRDSSSCSQMLWSLAPTFAVTYYHGCSSALKQLHVYGIIVPLVCKIFEICLFGGGPPRLCIILWVEDCGLWFLFHRKGCKLR